MDKRECNSVLLGSLSARAGGIIKQVALQFHLGAFRSAKIFLLIKSGFASDYILVVICSEMQ